MTIINQKNKTFIYLIILIISISIFCVFIVRNRKDREIRNLEVVSQNNQLKDTKSNKVEMDISIKTDKQAIREFLDTANQNAINGHFDRAISDYNMIIRMDPNNKEALMQRGAIFIMQSDFDKALDDFDKVISMDPTIAEAYCNKATIYLRKKEYDKGIIWSTKGIEVCKDKKYLSMLYVNRGLMLAIKGKYKHAQIDYDRAMSLDRSNPIIYFNKAKLLEKQGEKKEALKFYIKTTLMSKDKGIIDELAKVSPENETIIELYSEEAEKRVRIIKKEIGE